MSIQARIETLLQETGRKGIGELLKYMDDNSFFLAPCSSSFHLCKEGGLAEHSLNVYETMTKLNDSLGAEIPQDSIVIVSLLHDLGKAGQFGKRNYVPNILKSGKVSDSKPYETNKDLLYVPHEIRSIQIASQFIELTELENHAILFHNSLYGDLKYAINGKETKEQLLLHFADLYCARITEV